MDIRGRIEARLTELGLNRTQASRRAGKGATFLRDFLDNPTASMTIANAEQLASALEVSPAWLAFGIVDEDRALAEIATSWNSLGDADRAAILTLVRSLVRT